MDLEAINNCIIDLGKEMKTSNVSAVHLVATQGQKSCLPQFFKRLKICHAMR